MLMKLFLHSAPLATRLGAAHMIILRYSIVK